MNNHAPTTEQVGNGWTPGWVNWLMQVFQALPWNQGFSTAATINFAFVAGQSELSSNVTVRGAREGSVVLVTPTSNVTGMIFTGVVTAKDTVTVYAKNFTSVAIDPASQAFRIIVLN